jgi:hypothetical protein
VSFKKLRTLNLRNRKTDLLLKKILPIISFSNLVN